MRLLIVDDVPDSLKSMGELLRAHDHECLLAGTGKLALDVLKDARDKHETINGVIMDMVMPEMSGAAMLKGMIEDGITTPIIIITGYPERLESLTAAEAMLVKYSLVKPADPKEMVAAVGKYFLEVSNEDTGGVGQGRH